MVGEGDMHGRGHAWWGGMHGEGACVAGGHALQILRDTVNERAVRILLECILVNIVFRSFSLLFLEKKPLKFPIFPVALQPYLTLKGNADDRRVNGKISAIALLPQYTGHLLAFDTATRTCLPSPGETLDQTIAP